MAWTTRTSGARSSLEKIIYANNTFVAIGRTILTSPDGVTWTSRESGTSNLLSGITFGKNIFVAVGSAGAILTSPDGVTWTPRTSGTSYGLNAVTYGNGIFVAVGDTVIITSPDGVTWTPRMSGSYYGLKGVAYGNNKFVAVGGTSFSIPGVSYSYCKIFTSPDGITWTELWPKPTTADLQSIIYINGKFIAVGYVRTSGTSYYSDNGEIITSQNGITWTTSMSSNCRLNPFYDITYANNIYMAVGWNGSILISPDGVTWIRKISGTSHSLYGITYGKNTFVAIGGLSGIIIQSDPIVDNSNVEWSTNESYTLRKYYMDADDDGYGSDNYVQKGCSDIPPDGFVINNTDCDDSDATINPEEIEICDAIDNNCDGQIDEGLTQQTSCGTGECARTIIDTCTAGNWSNNTCMPGSPTAEICDNKDNDCDGFVDENLVRQSTCGIGECVNTGTETCTNGAWGNSTCTPGQPQTEGSYGNATCSDGMDNDCDGLKDAKDSSCAPPDLIVTSVAFTPVKVVRGGSITLTNTIKNQGKGPAGESATNYYLSKDNIKSKKDILLVNNSVQALAASASAPGTTAVTIPADTRPGSYYVIACADDIKQVAESNEKNNCRASKKIIRVRK